MKEKTLFKKIIDAEIPSYKIFEDENFLVFLDVFPRTSGHCLVIPKEEVVWVWETEKYTELMLLARRVATAQKKVFSEDMIFMDVRGDEVPHAHVHIRTSLPKDGREKNFEHWQEKIIEAFE